jgi:hypothetical protein
MADAFTMIKRRSNVPWLTNDGYINLANVPIDAVLRQTLSKDMDEFGSGCNLLQSMAGGGRTEAGIYLLGLLRHYQNDLVRLKIIVERLSTFLTPECAEALLHELKRVKSSNTSRGYLAVVLKILSRFPYEIAGERLLDLASDENFSYKMRTKFRTVLDAMRYPPSV